MSKRCQKELEEMDIVYEKFKDQLQNRSRKEGGYFINYKVNFSDFNTFLHNYIELKKLRINEID